MRAGEIVFTGMERVVFGQPAAASVAEAADRLGARRVFILAGSTLNRETDAVRQIAAALADMVIVTDDNPRSENPAAIRAAILATAKGAREIGDRYQAIQTAIAALGTGDVLVIAGKGHETGQIVGKQVLPFSDHEAVAAALAGGGTA